MNLIEKYIGEVFSVGDKVKNKKTGKKWTIKDKNKTGGIYCEDEKGNRTWFRQSDMVSEGSISREEVLRILKNRKKGKRSSGSSTPMQCMECGHKFKKKLGPNTFEVKCPKCKGYDTEPI